MTTQLDSEWLLLLPPFIRNRIEGRYNLQKILGNTGWLFLDKILRMGVGVIVGAWMARYLGPEQFGALSFATAFVAIFGVLAILGLDGIVVRDIVKDTQKSGEILASAFMLKICGGVAAFSVSLLAIWVMRPSDSQAHWLVGIIAAGMLFQAFDIVDLWFQSQIQSKYTAIARSSAFLLIAVVKIILILRHAQLIAFAWVGLAEIIVGAINLIIAYRINGQVFQASKFKLATAKRLLSESWPLILSGFSIMIYIRIGQIMLGQLLGQKEVGVYSAALRLSEIWYFIPAIVVSSIMPNISRAKAASEIAYYQQLKKVFDALVKIAYSVSIPMTFLSGPLVVFLYGESYSDAGIILSIHIWSSVFIFLGVAMSPWIINENMFKFSLFQTSLGAVINIALNFMFIPLWGPKGVAIATLVSQIFAAYLALLATPKTRIIFKMETRAILLRSSAQ